MTIQSSIVQAKLRCNSTGHGFGKLLNAITSYTVYKALRTYLVMHMVLRTGYNRL